MSIGGNRRVLCPAGFMQFNYKENLVTVDVDKVRTTPGSYASDSAASGRKATVAWSGL